VEALPRFQISSEAEVEAVVRSAWARRLIVLAVEQVGFSLAIVFGGGILMLLLGTQILNWYWFALLSAAALLVSIMRIRNRMLTQYRVAQVLDSRLHLSDSLSTALFLLTAADRRNDPVARLQIEQARQLAASVSPAIAFPFGRNRNWQIAGALGAIACGLFAVRYLVPGKLNFEQSLVPMHLTPVLERLEQSLSASAANQPAAYPGASEDGRSQGKSPQTQTTNDDPDLSRSHDPDLEQQQSNPSNGEESPARKITAQADQKPQNSESENKASSEPAQQRNPGDHPSPETREQANAPAQNAKEQSTGNQQSPSSLLEKMKEAATSLLAKMRSTPSPQNAAQNSDRSPDMTRTEEQTAAKNGQPGESANAQKQRTRNDTGSDGAEQGQTREKADTSDVRNSDKSPDQNGSDSRSGIGRQNGDKAPKEADQLQAMGKLAEIIGKRSADLTGEVTVEASSAKQRLKTEYSQQIGRHSDLGGEINRDEIPLMYQQYVREYMERVHKQDKITR
jgi:hypothetical protein